MRYIIVVNGIFLLISSIFAIKADETQLVLVQIVFRHGDRTPVEIYPNDPHKADVWDKYGGLGQLTQTGMKQHYAYGEYLRNRYTPFLNTYYNRERVSVKCTDYDRTMMSAQSLLASLYRPTDFQVWNANLTWQPIPVRTANMDNIFIANCPRLSELQDEITTTDEYKKTSDDYKDLIQVIDQESGFTDVTLNDLWKISDITFIEKNNDLTLPKWVQDNFEKLMQSKDLDFYFKFRTTEMGKLTSGGILNDIKKNIQAKTSVNSTDLELALFSSHDTYVAGMIKLLNLIQPIRAPPYVSSVTFELRKSKTGSKYYIQVYIKNNTADEPINPFLVPIEGCDLLCPLDDFMRIIANKTVENPSTVCAKQGHNKPINLLTNLTFLLSIGFVALVSLIIVICSIRTYRRLCSRSGYRQQEL